MLERWLDGCPELEHLQLDVAPGRPQEQTCQPLSPLAVQLCTSEERLLLACLDHIAAGNYAHALEAAGQAPEGGAIPDLSLLAGALLLAEGRIEGAVEPLRKAYAVVLDKAGSPE